MAGDIAQRRLVAILAADVVGYSRLMERDEAGTLALLMARRKQVLEPLVAKYHGRVFKVMGDGVLVEFASAVNAVQCALELQASFDAANRELADRQRVLLRIGINLGDVMAKGGDLYGDGVNIAARLESMADPGGILISGSAHEHSWKQVKCAFEDLGQRSLKNIAEPVRVHRIAGVAPAPQSPKSVSAPDKPCIAVLPFVNMSGDPEQEFFADGLTEDIITALSRVSGLTVIARTSSFVYKGQNRDTKRVAAELGAGYIMEGSVRRAGERVRVTAQLIDGSTGHHVWAERFDRPAGDMFDIQDEIMRSVAGSTETQIQLSERQAIEARPRAEPRATELITRAWGRIYDFTPAALNEASELAEQAIRLDPMNPRAHIIRARVHSNRLWFGILPPDAENVALGRELSEASVRLAPRDEWAHFCLAYAYVLSERPQDAAAACERAIELNPNFSNGYSEYGRALALLGRTEEAIAALRTALKLNPRDPSNWDRHCSLAIAHFVAGEFEAAVQESGKAVQLRPELPEGLIMLAAALAAYGKIAPARSTVDRIVAHLPKIHIGNVMPVYFPRFVRQEDCDRFNEMLRRAGLPD